MAGPDVAAIDMPDNKNVIALRNERVDIAPPSILACSTLQLFARDGNDSGGGRVPHLFSVPRGANVRNVAIDLVPPMPATGRLPPHAWKSPVNSPFQLLTAVKGSFRAAKRGPPRHRSTYTMAAERALASRLIFSPTDELSDWFMSFGG